MSKHIAKSLLDIEAVSLSPNDLFTWSSGIKSPIYCDNRITLGYPKVRQDIRDGLSELITCLLYTSPSPRDRTRSRMPSSA